MTKFLVIGDLHLKDTPPVSRVDDYCSAVLNKLDWCYQLCSTSGIKHVILLGDIFHSKRPNSTSHGLVRKIQSLMLEQKDLAGTDTYSVVGNHDISFSVDLLDRQPISVLKSSGAVKLLHGYCLVDGVTVAGLDYDDSRETNPDRYSVAPCATEHIHPRVLVIHQSVLPDGVDFFGNFLHFSDLKDLKTDVVLCGHLHMGYSPVVQYAYGKTWMNPGSLSRGSLDTDNLTRIPSVVVLDIETKDGRVDVETEVVPVPCRPASEVFAIAKAAEKKDKQAGLADFVDGLKVRLGDITGVNSMESMRKGLETISDEPGLVEAAYKYLENAKNNLE